MGLENAALRLCLCFPVFIQPVQGRTVAALLGLSRLYKSYEGGKRGRLCSASEPAAEVAIAQNRRPYKSEPENDNVSFA